MGLSKLLAVGRSVRSITGQQARYKMTQQNLLPTFGESKVAEARAAESVAPAVETAQKPPQATERMASKAVVIATRTTSSDKSAAFVEATKKLRPFGGGAWFKNPFTRSAASECERGPIQTELSLEAVRPVRNDLCEPDVELIRRADEPQAPILVPAQPVTQVSWWQRLKKRLSGATNTN